MAKEFSIGKTEGVCHACGEPLTVGMSIVALAKFAEDGLIREDYHPGCWVEPLEKDASPNVNVLGVWRTVIPEKQEKKKLLVDDDLLVNFFNRLAGQDEPDRIGFRYVLALILMRKKVLVYEGNQKRDGVEVWKMRFKKSDEIHEVIDPGLDEEKIAEVSESLGDIMEGDFE